MKIEIAPDARPRVHGNGFLQLDLTKGRRLHVWDDSLPRQEQDSSIHDHAFVFESEILLGRMTHLVFTATEWSDGKYDVLAPQRRPGTEDTKLAPTGARADLILQDKCVLLPGNVYEFGGPWKLHDTICSGRTATIIRKTHVHSNYTPKVYIPHGVEPDNEFDREAFDADDLWRLVFEVMSEVSL